jgi:histidinol-phosphate aminotransferase
MADREWVISEMAALGFETLPSAANFIFATHPEHDALQLASALREKGIIVRHFRQNRIEQFLRITIGTHAENQQLLSALDTLVD